MVRVSLMDPRTDEAQGDGVARNVARRSPLHGRRVGKALSDRQRDLVSSLLPKLAVDVSRPIDLTALFPGIPRAIRLEIGFGSGEHLIGEASRNENMGFIGCEPFLNGMAHALSEISAQNLGNVRLHCGDAGEVIERLPKASLEQVSILYPDPWPKRRQRKRRFIDDAMLLRLADIMTPGAHLRFATDIDDLCGWTLTCLMRSGAFSWAAESASDWQSPWADWVGTRYEAKAREQGRRPCYLTATRR